MKQQLLAPREKELALLAVAAIYYAPYITHTDQKLAAQINLSEHHIVAALAGETPMGLASEVILAYELALEVVRGRQPLSAATWDRAFHAFRREETAAVAHVASQGVYAAIPLDFGAIEACLEALD